LKIYEAAKQPLIAEFRQLTKVNPTQVAKFKDWLTSNGVELDNMRKETVNALLGLGDDDENGDGAAPEIYPAGLCSALPDVARRALTIRTLVGSSSVKKFARMVQCADPRTWRICRLLQYHGAGTGRWAPRLFNAHNMPRGLARVEDSEGRTVPPSPELLAKAISSGQLENVDALGCFIEYGDNRVTANPIEVLASALRSTIIADEGKYLLIGDWSAIEARLILAIAGQHDKTTLMASGVDVYLSMAEQIFNEKGLTKADVEKRQTGKNTVLGCGFQMGAEKFHERYCSHQPIEFAERAIVAYRKEWAPEVPKVWKALQEAALAAVQTGCSVDTGYGIIYRVKGNWLVGECPDGSELYYYRPTPCRRPMPWDPTDIRLAWKYQVPPGAKVNSFGYGDSGRWVSAYGGLLTENYIQHMARQLLARALGLCQLNGLPVILHNQDEIIVEHTNPDVAALKQIMEDRPRWAVDIQLPLAVECHPPCKRYHK
jgi:DNA polymerase